MPRLTREIAIWLYQQALNFEYQCFRNYPGSECHLSTVSSPDANSFVVGLKNGKRFRISVEEIKK